MSYTPETWEEKPYNRCVTCANLGKICDGPNFLAMTPERLGEWCQLRKAYLNSIEPGEWTLEKIEEKSGVSDTTINRIFHGDIGDRKLSYITAVLKVLVNGTWGQYPCILGGEEADLELIANARHTAAECEQLRKAMNRREEEHQRKIDFLKEQIQVKDNLLAERRDFINRKDRFIVILASLLAICVLAIIIALVADATSSELGFFWRQPVLSGFVSRMKDTLSFA